MRRAIGKHLHDFIALIALIVVASGVSYYILQNQRLRIPILEERPFELKAEFESTQAGEPGQGQASGFHHSVTHAHHASSLPLGRPVVTGRPPAILPVRG